MRVTSHDLVGTVAARQLLLGLLWALIKSCSSKESTSHGAYSPESLETHHVEHGHAAILGSQASDREWHKLQPSVAKSRLRELISTGVDANRDGFVTLDELKSWIYKNFKDANEDAAHERFKDADTDNNGKVTWSEHLAEAWGMDEDETNGDLMHPADYADDRLLIKEDRVLFDAADADHDGELNADEYFRFLHPEEHSDMHPVITQNALKSRDLNHDGKISWDEYITGVVPADKRTKEEEELYQTEKTHFDQVYDLDHDGFLSGQEIYSWLVPDDAGSAELEAKHLMDLSDADKDERLSMDEVLANYKDFVGSEATQHGDLLDDDEYQHAADEL